MNAKRKKRILVDVDGVLADFVGAFLDITNRIAGSSLTPEAVTSWNLDDIPEVAAHSEAIWKETGRPGFARNLKLFPGAVEAVEMLKSHGEVYLLTAPLWAHKEHEDILFHGQTFCYDRVKWAHENFGIPSKNVMFAYPKELVDGEMLIDDKVENIQGWLENHGRRPGRRAILWAQPYNTHGKGCHPRVTRTDSWADVNAVLSK